MESFGSLKNIYDNSDLFDSKKSVNTGEFNLANKNLDNEDIENQLWPLKVLRQDRPLFLALARYARYANYGYCMPNNDIGKSVSNVIADAIISSKPKAVIVYFKGKKFSVQNWYEWDSSLVEYPKLPSKVDKVMLDHVQAMKPALTEKIKLLLQKDPETLERVRFVGHGIGGAYAVLAALLVKDEFQETVFARTNIVVYTFGQPRIGNEHFSKYVSDNLKVFRFTHTNDILTRFPVYDRGLRHPETEFWIASRDCNCPPSIFKINDNYLEFDYDLWMCRVYQPETGHLKVQDHPKCNAGEIVDISYQSENDNPHNGPYFNVLMGKCNSILQPDIFQDLPAMY
ncbi:hypothetical protein G9A89_002389 [Geosiphon pyriformis]|nr:hypothetical protein G9A89_002389 [Geosiphon pyriformis]